jgi:hypothetical protein
MARVDNYNLAGNKRIDDKQPGGRHSGPDCGFGGLRTSQLIPRCGRLEISPGNPRLPIPTLRMVGSGVE